jgi:SAM-dependent methyltransferase
MKSNLEWKKWGEIDPLYAVSTWEGKERGSKGAWTDEEFYELGRKDWQDFERQWRQYGVQFGSIVEIGCGAGRITRQLAGAFAAVTALDVSEHQVDYARSHLPAQNVNFKVTDGSSMPLETGSMDAVFSVHVFQHFESHQDALNVFGEIHRVLKAGGTFMIHLPIFQLPDSKIAKPCQTLIGGWRVLAEQKARVKRALLKRGIGRPLMRRLEYDKRALFPALKAIGFGAVELRSFAVASNGSFHDFVFAAKESAASAAGA